MCAREGERKRERKKRIFRKGKNDRFDLHDNSCAVGKSSTAPSTCDSGETVSDDQQARYSDYLVSLLSVVAIKCLVVIETVARSLHLLAPLA